MPPRAEGASHTASGFWSSDFFGHYCEFLRDHPELEYFPTRFIDVSEVQSDDEDDADDETLDPHIESAYDTDEWEHESEYDTDTDEWEHESIDSDVEDIVADIVDRLFRDVVGSGTASDPYDLTL